MKGGGVSGLSSALALKTAFPHVSITVLDKGNSSNDMRVVGIWNKAMICLQKWGIYSDIEAKLEPVLRSGYRNSNGDWLAQPTIFGTKGFPVTPSLSFIDENVLKDSLRKKIQHEGVLIQTQKVCSIGYSIDKKKTYIFIQGGQIIEADLVVAADGANSIIRGMLYSDTSFLNYRGK